MYTWRAQIGLISPGTGPNMERDFHRFIPDGVGINTTRIPFSGTPSPEGLMDMVSHLENTCQIFRGSPQDCVMFGCTSGSLIGGPGFDRKLVDLITEASGSPGLTTSTVLVEAFKALGVSSAAVITPYPDDTNEVERQFLEHHGIHVTRIEGMNYPEDDIALIKPQLVYEHLKKLDKTGADCLFISCTGLNVLDLIKIAEEDFGRPVLTSNQATLWGALRHAQVGVKLPYLGELFTNH
ncbi:MULTISPECIES: maleate cis-trans isomerase family protein [Oscillospiraceae]|jgi:arylmalonate decarboxylase|uniref:Arylmalonate decarboxylase n=1 Tax=Lawsonibacter faecis TaxID=2763052 RepID=A0A8J6JK04_9FIRM|nr:MULTISPECIES: aspartate/glutamate racemase family protein [Oscillospiraceae]MTQ96024.1 arylmalonate decarboxylase [Pseudoflavonifractor sp. BIOML-A16]MTR04776.1 arylmalonate decarboxylase [Pseudoflavonifractor sp. BIOML-A15]MTR30976.1 arylmalonate decarboxylase [Pseudoflavonifractor sp. BIOML-A14]MTR71541.1 arylmalonate decarboxylase [Pseudoflavonifractor sp. BIOML-A18]MTS62916.1 arylmalonate decarboxylase [Pseudoflavonifractor sp. BIOML-A5]MTS71490.1 arylmalonate decarboxylase [Pseudoflav